MIVSCLAANAHAETRELIFPLILGLIMPLLSGTFTLLVGAAARGQADAKGARAAEGQEAGVLLLQVAGKSREAGGRAAVGAQGYQVRAEEGGSAQGEGRLEPGVG